MGMINEFKDLNMIIHYSEFNYKVNRGGFKVRRTPV